MTFGRRAGVGAARRSGFRALGGDSTAPSAPTIALATTFTIGASITITPAAGGGPVTSFAEYADGVATGRTVAATGAPISYTIVAGDLLPEGVTFRAAGPGGTSVDSNTLTYALPTANFVVDIDGTHVTLTGGFISAAADQSGAGNNYGDIGAAGNRPAQSVAGGPNGLDAIDFSLRAAAAVGLTKANVGVGTGPVTIYDVAQVPVGARYLCDGAAINSRAKISGGTNLSLYSGASAAAASCIAGDWVRSSAVFNGASSKHSIDGGTDATGNVGATTNAGDTWGGTAGAANPNQCANTKAARRILYAAAHSDATRADIEAYLSLWQLNSPGSSRFEVFGDSIVKGYNGTAYNGGWRATVRTDLPALKHVGQYYSFGSHDGISGETAATLAGALSTRVAAQLSMFLPSKIGLAIGVNDIRAGTSTATIQGYLTSIIAQFRTSRPGVPIFVQNIIQPIGGLDLHDAEATTFNAGFPAFCTSLGSDVHPVIITPYTVTSTDTVHPDDPSYTTIIAPLWTAALT